METWVVVAVDKAAKIRIREENKFYEGVKWLLRYPDGQDPDNFIGFGWREQFMSNERLLRLQLPKNPMPGDTITLVFDRAGGICDIKIV